MKHLIAVFITALFLSGCISSSGDGDSIDYRQEMREFVIGISSYAKSINPEFVVIPQNGVELITQDGLPDGELAESYVRAVDGQGQEDLFYGYYEDNIPTPPEETDWLTAFLDRLKLHGKQILVTDYCTDRDKVDDSYRKNSEKGYISLATVRELNIIPSYPAKPYNSNPDDVYTLRQAKNFLYLINPENYTTKDEFISDLDSTNYDLFIIDAFFKGEPLTADDVNRLKTKPNGARRLVIAYMSIGEAEDYRYYWQDEWYFNPPEWLAEENPDWPGNYKVRYWYPQWQDIIYRGENSYLDRILSAGFDGVYLDIIDAYEYFEGL
ncbi:endo alpha-1,4 polygalactosaminidase [Persephonella sp.]